MSEFQPPSQKTTGGARNDVWRAIVDAMPDAAVVLSASRTILHHNKQATYLFPNVRNQQSLSYLSRNPDLIAAVEQAWDAPDVLVVHMQERVPLERRIRVTISRLNVVQSSRDHPQLLLTFRDLSEEDKLDQMRADFVANASHELRTPLASLKGYVETLQGAARDDAEARDRFLSIMWTQASRMTRLIDDLLSLSRVEMRAHLTPEGDVDLNEIVMAVFQTLEPVANAADIAIHVTTHETPARIVGDRDEIAQVVQNLVQNAVKYGRENGRVDVSVYRVPAGTLDNEKPGFAVAVSDDGPGIAPEHLPRLTERFYRVNVESSRRKGGTGLGLAIVKHIVARHRGDLRIESKLGRGSTFTVVFDAR